MPKFFRISLLLNYMIDLIPSWYKDRYCPPPPPPPLPPPHTHTRSCQNQGHRLRIFQKQNVQYQASYPVWRQVLLISYRQFYLLPSIICTYMLEKKCEKSTLVLCNIDIYNFLDLSFLSVGLVDYSIFYYFFFFYL